MWTKGSSLSYELMRKVWIEIEFRETEGKEEEVEEEVEEEENGGFIMSRLV